jgi:hypothetical protein
MKVLITFIFLSSFLSVAQAETALLSEEMAADVRGQSRVQYDKIYPYYIEVTSMNQVERNGAPLGGSAGHSFAYIKGLCRDISAPYPRVKLCEKRTKPFTAAEEAMGIGYNDITNPNSGIGVSVNKEFQNVNWVAIPTKDLFFYGKIKPGERLTKEYMGNLANYVVKLGTHKGIILHDEYNKGSTSEEILKNVILDSMDTDFASVFGRYIDTLKIPIKESMLPYIVKYLNDINDYYARDGHIYNWSGVYNNCAHFTNNLLASIGFTKQLKVGMSKFAYFDFSLAVPANRMLSFANTAQEGDLNDAHKVYGDSLENKMLTENKWLAVEPGIIVDLIKPVPQELNDMYKINPPTAILMVELPTDEIKRIFDLEPSLKQEAIEIMHDPRYIDIEANRKEFEQKYSNFQLSHPFFETAKFKNFEVFYSGVIQENLSEMRK